jgi:predicted MFS family arabinose efflux permease
MLGPLFAVFAERVGGDIFDITAAWATYLIVTGIFNILVGALTDRKISKEKVMIAGYILNTIFTFGYLFVSSPFGLFFVQAGLGIACAMATPTWNALYAKYENKKRDGLTWGLADGEANMVTGIAIILGGFIVSHFSFTLLFFVMGCVQLIATIYQTRLLKARLVS